MSSDITLSAGVRANLLSLQDTAQLMETTQNRLATGKKVNSALDNPLNFFTSSALQSRAGDLNSLLDSMSIGIQTIQAANNGLSSITKTVQSMQSTLNQARQDKSFQTTSYDVGTVTSGSLNISGGSVATATSINMISGGTQAAAATNAALTGASTLGSINVGNSAATTATVTEASAPTTTAPATGAAVTEGAFTNVDFTNAGGNNGSITFNLNVDGGGATAVTIGYADVSGVQTASSGSAVTASELAGIINTKFGSSVASVVGGKLVFSSSTTGAGSSVAVTGFSATNGATGSGIANGSATGTAATTTATMDVTGGHSLTFNLSVDGTSRGITIDAAAVTTYNATNGTSLNGASLSDTDVANIINSQFGATVASDNGGKLAFTSQTTGAASNVTISSVVSNLNNGGSSGIAASNTTGVAAGANAALTFNVNGHQVTLSTTGGTGGVGNYTATDIKNAINTQVGVSAKVNATINGSNQLVLTSTGTAGASDTVTVNGFSTGDASQLGLTASGFASASAHGADATTTGGTQKTVDQLVTEINGNANLSGHVVASNDSGKLRIQNLSTSALNIIGASASAIDGTSSSSTTIGGNDVRKGLIQQFNDLRDQLDKLADDSVFNGVNLLRGDNLKITLNETGSSTINIQSKKPDGTTLVMDSAGLGISAAQSSDFDSDTTISSKLTSLSQSLSTLQAQTTAFGSNLSSVQTRQDFTKNMINTLQTGADGLVLADTNQEGANLLALQTRQSLSSTALSMAAQADQNVLRLFG